MYVGGKMVTYSLVDEGETFSKEVCQSVVSRCYKEDYIQPAFSGEFTGLCMHIRTYICVYVRAQ